MFFFYLDVLQFWVFNISAVENQSIEQILERMEKNQKDFFEKILILMKCPSPEDEVWVDGVEVQKILNITRRTVSRLILNGTLDPRPIGGRNYFAKSSIFKLRNRFKK